MAMAQCSRASTPLQTCHADLTRSRSVQQQQLQQQQQVRRCLPPPPYLFTAAAAAPTPPPPPQALSCRCALLSGTRRSSSHTARQLACLQPAVCEEQAAEAAAAAAFHGPKTQEIRGGGDQAVLLLLRSRVQGEEAVGSPIRGCRLSLSPHCWPSRLPWAAPRTPCSMPPSAASICRPSTSRSASRAGHLTPPPPAACCRRYSPFALPLLAGRANTHPAPAREALPLPRVLQAPQHRQVAGGAQPECGACVGGAAAAATSVLSRSVPRSA